MYGAMVVFFGSLLPGTSDYKTLMSYIHTWIHTYIYTCIHTYIHTYTHTYIHVHTYYLVKHMYRIFAMEVCVCEGGVP